jgi:hypothetical protein
MMPHSTPAASFLQSRLLKVTNSSSNFFPSTPQFLRKYVCSGRAGIERVKEARK